MKKTLKTAIIDTLPIMTGYIFLGIAFGILMQKNGFGFWWSVLSSTIIYAGSMQFVLVGLLSGGAGLLHAAIMTLSVNARHIFYGLSMITRFAGMGLRKPYLIFSLSDETYSLLCSKTPPSGVLRENYYLAVSLLDQLYWIAGTAIGAAAGSLISFDATGIDFAMTALFVVIFIEQWEQTTNHFPALLGVSASVLAVIAFGPELFLIPALAVILAVLLIFRKRRHAE